MDSNIQSIEIHTMNQHPDGLYYLKAEIRTGQTTVREVIEDLCPGSKEGIKLIHWHSMFSSEENTNGERLSLGYKLKMGENYFLVKTNSQKQAKAAEELQERIRFTNKDSQYYLVNGGLALVGIVGFVFAIAISTSSIGGGAIFTILFLLSAIYFSICKLSNRCLDTSIGIAENNHAQEVMAISAAEATAAERKEATAFQLVKAEKAAAVRIQALSRGSATRTGAAGIDGA